MTARPIPRPITRELLDGFYLRVQHTVADEAHRRRVHVHDLPDHVVCRAVADVSQLYPSLTVPLIADTLTRVMGAGYGAAYRDFIYRRLGTAA